VLSPVFALSFVLAGRLAASVVWLAAAWILVVVIELTDILDGMVARSGNAVSDLGKVLDPFADVVSKVTYFVCLLTVGIVPLWFVLLLLYREFGIILIRMLLYRTGVALAARTLGKIKTWFYAVSAAVGLLFFSAQVLESRLSGLERFLAYSWIPATYTALLAVTALFAVVSFIQYFTVFLRARKDL
jgi:CDP-diacylglycerol--glycerol-3-phosphate 3-phosphatidyltransferase